MVGQGSRVGVQVEMNPLEAELYKEFVRHQKNLTTLMASGALDIRSNSFTCHMDASGHIRRIDRVINLFTE